MAIEPTVLDGVKAAVNSSPYQLWEQGLSDLVEYIYFVTFPTKLSTDVPAICLQLQLILS